MEKTEAHDLMLTHFDRKRKWNMRIRAMSMHFFVMFRKTTVRTLSSAHAMDLLMGLLKRTYFVNKIIKTQNNTGDLPMRVIFKSIYEKIEDT